MNTNIVYGGYLDVKVSAKSRRGFTPWKAWHSQWCEIWKEDSIETGAQLKLSSSRDGDTINCVLLPQSSTVCRIESRSKKYAFGVFKIGIRQKPLLFLSGISESHTQKWMELIRKTLCVASFFTVGALNFHVSLVDNAHSRAAGLTGLFGILLANSKEILINHPSTGKNIVKWKWHQFHQFHLQAVMHPDDENYICVFHTSSEFIVGAGQLLFFCKEASGLLQFMSRGKRQKLSAKLAASQRLSLSEGDLSKFDGNGSNSNGLWNLSDSDDSGVRVSISSDDSDSNIQNKNSSSMTALFKTPGGSEVDDDDLEDVNVITCQPTLQTRIPRGESGVSLASGDYEEISENVPEKNNSAISDYTNGHMVHLYEDLEELTSCISFKHVPPPLPPRIFCCRKQKIEEVPSKSTRIIGNFIRNSYKYRSNTLPAKDLRRLSQNFTAEADYMVMKPKTRNVVLESLYVPMSPIISLKTKIENCYMVMSGKKC